MRTALLLGLAAEITDLPISLLITRTDKCLSYIKNKKTALLSKRMAKRFFVTRKPRDSRVVQYRLTDEKNTNRERA